MHKRPKIVRYSLALPIVASMISGMNPAFARQSSDADSTADEPIDQIVVVAHKSERSVREIAANVTVV